MANCDTLELRFEGEHATIKDEVLSLPETPMEDTEGLRRLRGMCDSLALWLRYHDPVVHHEVAPNELVKRGIFDALEQLRCSIVGSRRLAGARRNLRSFVSQQAGLTGAVDRGNSSCPGAANDILLLAYEALAGEQLSVRAGGVKLGREYESPVVQELLATLAAQQENQLAFAKTSVRLIGALVFTDDAESWEVDERLSDEGREREVPANNEQTEFSSTGEEEVHRFETDSEVATATPGTIGEAQAGERIQNRPEQSRDFPTYAEPLRKGPGRRARAAGYRIFNSEYDRIVTASELVMQGELRRLRESLDGQFPAMHGRVRRLANRLQRHLYAKQLKNWEFDQEEGLLDSGRLDRIVINPLSALSFKKEKMGDVADTVVSLLIDNSGSMAGRKIAVAAICSDILASTFERCGIRTEILGFTTRSWFGGRVRARWLETGAVRHPGRLNELLHIVYKSADQPWRQARLNLGAMLRPSFMRENIDGEALLWAHSRLIYRPQARRILIVISDGAPIDDATLAANGHGYLERHLREVTNAIESTSPVELSAIGIGHDVSSFYSDAVTIRSVDELGETIFGKLSELFEGQRPRKRRRRH